MKNRKLVSMVEFVLDGPKEETTLDLNRSKTILYRRMRKCQNYANFLNTPLELGMFVPCDEDGNVLEESNKHSDRGQFVRDKEHERKIKQYQEAKENVLFEGFKYISQNTVRNDDLDIFLTTMQFMIEGSLGIGGGDICGNDIEALAKCDLDIILTESAIKKYEI